MYHFDVNGANSFGSWLSLRMYTSTLPPHNTFPRKSWESGRESSIGEPQTGGATTTQPVLRCFSKSSLLSLSGGSISCISPIAKEEKNSKKQKKKKHNATSHLTRKSPKFRTQWFHNSTREVKLKSLNLFLQVNCAKLIN